MLVETNINLAHHLALTAWRRNTHRQEKDEVVAAAYEGLVKAALIFDPSRANVIDGVPDTAGAFAGFARQKINGAILDWQKRNDHVPRRHRSTYKELQSLGHGQGRSPSELSDLTGLPEEQVRMLIRAVEAPPLSLARDENTAEEFHDSEWSTVAPGSVEGSVLEGQIKDVVVDVFDDLQPLQQLVLALRYYEGMDLTSISVLLDVRISSIRAAHAEGLLMMHAAMVEAAS